MPFDPWRVWGQFMIWLWCYNTIGLQWCCSSSLTLLAPPTGPLLPTLLPLCLLGSAPCSRQAMYGWPMRRWRPWQPLPKRSVPLCPSSPFSLSVSHVFGCESWYQRDWMKTGWWLMENACVIYLLSSSVNLLSTLILNWILDAGMSVSYAVVCVCLAWSPLLLMMAQWSHFLLYFDSIWTIKTVYSCGTVTQTPHKTHHTHHISKSHFIAFRFFWFAHQWVSLMKHLYPKELFYLMQK